MMLRLVTPACLLIGLAVLAGWIWSWAPADLPPLVPLPVENATAPSTAAPLAPSDPPTLGWTKAVFHFPAADPVPVAAPAPEPVVAPPVVAEKELTLVGLVDVDGQRIALIRAANAEAPTHLREGMLIEGWTVHRIEPRRVILTRGTEERKLPFTAAAPDQPGIVPPGDAPPPPLPEPQPAPQ
jgi:hypothetical protein